MASVEQQSAIDELDPAADLLPDKIVYLDPDLAAPETITGL